MTFPSGLEGFLGGLREGADLVLSGNRVVFDTMVRTLRLAGEATAVAAVAGVPIGCLLGLGRFRGARLLLLLASAVTRVPPVAIGVLVVLLVTSESPSGGGPLASLHWYGTTNSGYLAQTLLAVPIVIALTAAAVRDVPVALLDQARAFGAPGWRRGVLAVREARRSVIAALLVVMGVTMTTIGALIVAGSGNEANVQVGHNAYIGEPATLALGAFLSIREADVSTNTPPPGVPLVAYPTQALAVAYTIVLLSLFVLIAAALTRLQRERPTWLPGQPS